ncbi:MAG: hypothetical protein CXT73_04225 [Methanobacteriota archaeon]|nr:MAG: hypothetical protein CXT73_04225 [Euryarchaeota archaeon]
MGLFGTSLGKSPIQKITAAYNKQRGKRDETYTFFKDLNDILSAESSKKGINQVEMNKAINNQFKAYKRSKGGLVAWFNDKSTDLFHIIAMEDLDNYKRKIIYGGTVEQRASLLIKTKQAFEKAAVGDAVVQHRPDYHVNKPRSDNKHSWIYYAAQDERNWDMFRETAEAYKALKTEGIFKEAFYAGVPVWKDDLRRVQQIKIPMKDLGYIGGEPFKREQLYGVRGSKDPDSNRGTTRKPLRDVHNYATTSDGYYLSKTPVDSVEEEGVYPVRDESTEFWEGPFNEEEVIVKAKALNVSSLPPVNGGRRRTKRRKYRKKRTKRKRMKKTKKRKRRKTKRRRRR